MILLGYLLAFLYGIICVGGAGILYKYGVKKTITRKAVHILVGFEWVILYIFHGAGVHFFAVCAIFTLLLFLEYKKHLLPMMSSDSENAPGTVYYGISMAVMSFVTIFVPECIYPFGIAVFCTSFGDGFAGIVGAAFKKHNLKIYKEKTLFGAIANFVISFLVTLIFSLIFKLGISILFIIITAFLSTGLELLGERGLDNIALPMGVFTFSSFAIFAPDVCINYFVPIALTPFVIIFAKVKNVLTDFAILSALALDFVISAALGNFGFTLLLSFLLLSTVVDKIKKRIQKKEDSVSEKGDKRDEIQVLSNGIIAMFMALFFLVDANRVFIFAFIASLSEAFADTCGSGFGAVSKKTYNIIGFKEIKKGISGGVSLIGTLGSLAAAFLITAIALLFGVISAFEYLAISLIAFIGTIFDSVLGSLLQVKFICTKCNDMTEKRIHCGTLTEKKSGISFVTNDTVNLLSTLFSASLTLVFFIII